MTTEDAKAQEESKKFDPKTLSPEASEYVRREIQSESDRKGQAEGVRLKEEAVEQRRAEAEKQREAKLQTLADEGKHEELGEEIAKQLKKRSAQADAVAETSDTIEAEIVDAFSDITPERKEEIRQDVIAKGGRHGAFARALAAELSGKAVQSESKAEEQAGNLQEALTKRESVDGADEASEAGGGAKPTSKEEFEREYVAGRIDAETYEEGVGDETY